MEKIIDLDEWLSDVSIEIHRYVVEEAIRKSEKTIEQWNKVALHVNELLNDCLMKVTTEFNPILNAKIEVLKDIKKYLL